MHDTCSKVSNILCGGDDESCSVVTDEPLDATMITADIHAEFDSDAQSNTETTKLNNYTLPILKWRS
jgi:hypothetical protein